MSRTDKDMPWWVTGEWAPEHTAACKAGRRPLCRLESTRWKPQHWDWRTFLRSGLCYWEPQGPRRYHGEAPPRWFVNHRWSAPDRMAARVACDRARAEHRAGYEPEPPTRRHRHSARWDWN